MKILQLEQGSPEWVAARKHYRCASEAPAMMGADKKTTRSELLRLKATGEEREFSEWVQRNLLDRGKAVEAFARSEIERLIGEDLFPATACDDDDYLLASFDGITMAGDTGVEFKVWNEELATCVRNGEVPPSHYWQLEHQILVGGLERVLFVVTDGTPERFVYTEYRPVPGRAEQLLRGWKQFDEDAAHYQPVEVLPPVHAEPVLGLPALTIQVQGEIRLVDNLAVFGARLKAFVEAIDREPSDDQGFANAEAACKILHEAQERLDAAESAALAQTASIDEMRRTVDLYRQLARSTRLTLEKVVEARKKQLRAEICQNARAALDQHIDRINQRIGKPYVQAVPADFLGVIKGKKTLTSIRDAVDGELARAKIAASEIADRIELNLKAIREAKHDFLFADEAQLVLKEPDTVRMTVTLRVNQHKAEEKARFEAEQERMRQEAARVAAHVKPPEPVLPIAPSPSNTLAFVKPLGTERATVSRPSDDEIIGTVATAFGVDAATAIQWLRDMNLDTAEKRLTA